MNISGLVGARWRNIYLTSQLSNPNKESSVVGEPTHSIKNWTEKRVGGRIKDEFGWLREHRSVVKTKPLIVI